jgi:methyltransferase-like protein/predicted O-methyltransferase YrrM
MTLDPLRQSYEETPYPDLCYTQTHPDRLATLAILLGLEPAPVERCRVLELGCARGGNLIPMAYALPQSEFLGVDFAPGQIAAGQAMIDDLGLDNVTLRAADILDLGPDLGEFDYIIAHGVYSWVPAPVRDKALAICRDYLAPHGIAYVSYNVYPGWRMLGALRDMMLYHTRDVTDPAQKAQQARALLDFLAESVSPKDPYGTFGKAYRQLLANYTDFVSRERQREQLGDQLLLHDELETENTPVYFHQFVEHAAAYELQYLVEADFARVMVSNLPPQVGNQLQQWARNSVEMEQYLDFLRNRTFRQTLLCPAQVDVSRRLQPDMRRFRFATYAQPTQTPFNIEDNSAVQFRTPDGAVITTDHPVSKAALSYLVETAPTAVPFDTLLAVAAQRVYGKTPNPALLQQDAQALTATILQAYSYSVRLVELHVHPFPFTVEVDERPFASGVARYQAEAGLSKVANLRHERVKLDPISRHLLPYLDGSRDVEGLTAVLLNLVEEGQLRLEQDGEPVTDAAAQRQVAEQEVRFTLRWLARAALLEVDRG